MHSLSAIALQVFCDFASTSFLYRPPYAYFLVFFLNISVPINDVVYFSPSFRDSVVNRNFAVAGARLWNNLSPDVVGDVASDILLRLRRELKTFLFRQSYPFILF